MGIARSSGCQRWSERRAFSLDSEKSQLNQIFVTKLFSMHLVDMLIVMLISAVHYINNKSASTVSAFSY